MDVSGKNIKREMAEMRKQQQQGGARRKMTTSTRNGTQSEEGRHAERLVTSSRETERKISFPEAGFSQSSPSSSCSDECQNVDSERIVVSLAVPAELGAAAAALEPNEEAGIEAAVSVRAHLIRYSFEFL